METYSGGGKTGDDQVMVKDRVKEFRRVKASELRPHPSNWRTHPSEQRNVLRGVLDEVGIAGALIAYEGKDGLVLIDGHLRKDAEPEAEWPVLVLDVDEEEARKLLVTTDPIAAMAETDQAKLNDLIAELDSDSAEIRRMFDEMSFESVGELRDSSSVIPPGAIHDTDMELKPEEHYDYVVVCADNVNDWNRLVRILDLPDVHSARHHRRVGLGRAVSARKVLELIDRDE